MWESKQTVDEWKEDVVALTEKLEEEEEMWKRQGFSFSQISIDNYVLQFKLNMLVTFLNEEFGVSLEELEARFKREVIEQLRRDRGMLIENRTKAQRPDLTVIQRPALLGPNGRPIL